jgi:hypothetical protein
MNLLDPLVDGRTFFDAAPSGTPLPYLTIQQVGGSPLQFLEGPSSKDYVRLQINVFASSRPNANGLMTVVREALTPLKAMPVGAPISTYEETVQTFGRHCDFSILTAV